jgi:hypothetical protein
MSSSLAAALWNPHAAFRPSKFAIFELTQQRRLLAF